MILFRLLLVVLVTLSASVPGAMDAGHPTTTQHGHAALDQAADEEQICCTENSERAQTCHVLAALLPGGDVHGTRPATCGSVSVIAGVLLTGIEPSGPLDPPRAV